MTQVLILYEKKRGCGFRTSGADGVGLYLMGDPDLVVCPRLPFPLTVCPCCGAGIKFSRGFTWIQPGRIFDPDLEPKSELGKSGDLADPHQPELCAMCNPEPISGPQAGLMWVGAAHYSPHSFVREARQRGISKKIAALPRGFVIGEHRIYLAHKQAVTDFENLDQPASPGVFMVFKPTHIDLVIDDEEDVPEKALRLKEKFGDQARLIKVVRDEAIQGDLLG